MVLWLAASPWARQRGRQGRKALGARPPADPTAAPMDVDEDAASGLRCMRCKKPSRAKGLLFCQEWQGEA